MRLAILFPGQGSQSVGMLSGFAGNDAVAGCGSFERGPW